MPDTQTPEPQTKYAKPDTNNFFIIQFHKQFLQNTIHNYICNTHKSNMNLILWQMCLQMSAFKMCL